LSELELWEVSLVTFPMLPEARVAAKAEALDDDWRDMAAVFEDARRTLAGL
jgi:phage head maturation protease